MRGPSGGSIQCRISLTLSSEPELPLHGDAAATERRVKRTSGCRLRHDEGTVGPRDSGVPGVVNRATRTGGVRMEAVRAAHGQVKPGQARGSECGVKTGGRGPFDGRDGHCR